MLLQLLLLLLLWGVTCLTLTYLTLLSMIICGS
jgi:hypothetical protein